MLIHSTRSKRIRQPRLDRLRVAGLPQLHDGAVAPVMGSTRIKAMFGSFPSSWSSKTFVSFTPVAPRSSHK